MKKFLLLLTFLFFIPEILADKRAPKGQCYISIGYVSDRDSVTDFAKKSLIKAKDFELFERKDKKVYLTLGKIDKNLFKTLESEGETYDFNCSSGKGYEERFGLNSEFQIVGGSKININSVQQFMSVVSSIEIEKQRLIDIEVEKQVQARLATEKEKQRLAMIEEQRKEEAAAEVERQVQARVAELEKQRLAMIEEQRKEEATAEVERQVQARVAELEKQRQADEVAKKEKQRLAMIEEQRKEEAEKQIQAQAEEREQIKEDNNILYYDCKQPVDNTALEYSRAVLLQVKPDTKNFKIKARNDSEFSHQEFDSMVYSFDTNGNLLKDKILGLKNKTHLNDAYFFWDDVTNLLGFGFIEEISVDAAKKQLFLGMIHKFNCKEVIDKDKTEAAVNFIYDYTDKFFNEMPKIKKEVPKIETAKFLIKEKKFDQATDTLFNEYEQGNRAEAAYLLGTLHYWGDGLERSESKAFEYYKESIRLGSLSPAWEISKLYGLGEGGARKSQKLRYMWIYIASQRGLNVGFFLSDAKNKISQQEANEAEAVAKKCMNGDVEACFKFDKKSKSSSICFDYDSLIAEKQFVSSLSAASCAGYYSTGQTQLKDKLELFSNFYDALEGEYCKNLNLSLTDEEAQRIVKSKFDRGVKLAYSDASDVKNAVIGIETLQARMQGCGKVALHFGNLIEKM
jgi:TPR repeat protein